ncbi:hypothetical protein CLAIMM_06771 [Cladophialophora immunda]|nr:hypothetical protein CLAIMM_06771 [Cladophialophora immunda]
MSSPSPSLPPPTAISPTAFHEALQLYPSLVEKVYRSKLKNDDKKVADALKRDRWRFEELPAAVAAGVGSATAAAQASKKDSTKKKKNSPDAQDGGGGGLAKDAVERLVQWKITHGHSRPFLPAMVRKNDGSTIQAQTSLAFAKLFSSPSSTLTSASASTPPRPTTAAITAALDAVCKLTGIGPATGTLILNVFDPVHVPFFQDEMFLWFFPAAKADKLKYTLKEYLTLLDAALPVLETLNVTALQLEQVAYVLGHVELLEAAERQALLDAFEGHGPPPSGHESHGPVRAVDDHGDHDAKDTGAPQQQERQPALKGRKRAAKDEDGKGEEAQAPKRRSQRRK